MITHIFPVHKNALLRNLTLLVFVLVFASCGDEATAPQPVKQSDPIIISIQPDSVYAGDEIIITGENFSTVTSANIVTFTGGAQGTVVAAAATSLVVTVPQGAQTGKVSVTVGEKTAESPEELTVWQMTLFVYITVKQAVVGDTLVIFCRQGLPADPAKVAVMFGNVQADIIDIGQFLVPETPWHQPGVRVRVPAGVVTGPVTLLTRGLSASTESLAIVTRLLPYRHCVVEVSGLRMKLESHEERRRYSGGELQEEKITDTTYQRDFSFRIDSRTYQPLATLVQGFANNVYELRDGENKLISMELDPVTHAVVALTLDSSASSSSTGGHNWSSGRQQKRLVIKDIQKPGSTSHQYELTGDEIRQYIQELVYSHAYTSSQLGGSFQSSGWEKTIEYECPSTARITIRFFD